MTNSRAKAVILEASKVFVVFVAFYLLQSQIIQIRYDIFGSASGLAEAQALTHTELDDTKQLLALTLRDSTLELARAKRALEHSVADLERQRSELLAFLEERTRKIEEALSRRLEEDRRAVETAKTRLETTAARLEQAGAFLDRDPVRMKRAMVFPTIQLRGNGTVGSGVLVYSQPQPGIGGGTVATSLALTAYHVVSEVCGGRLDRDLEEVHVFREDDPRATEVYSATVLLFDRSRDLALLRLNSPRRFPYLAELASLEELESLDVFSPAYAVGCPLGNRPIPTLGEISSTSKQVGDQTFWMLSAPTFFGNSGGGVYLVPDCKLIGISSMIYTYGKRHPAVVPHMGLFVPLRTIYAWLEAEGYGFIRRREPVPPALRWKVAYASPGLERGGGTRAEAGLRLRPTLNPPGRSDISGPVSRN